MHPYDTILDLITAGGVEFVAAGKRGCYAEQLHSPAPRSVHDGYSRNGSGGTLRENIGSGL